VLARTAELQAANEELEAFSYSVSHDLRAPLRTMDGFADMLQTEYGASLPADGMRCIRVIRDSAQRMGALIDDLLAFSRLGREQIRPVDVDMHALVHETLAELRAGSAGRTVELEVGEIRSCRGDRALLKQVWANLLSNAFKYTRRRDTARIVIGSMEDAAGNRIYFVRDNGTGFDMRYADKLFGVFQRLHHVKDFEGTGVGLAIVQRVVQRHGGRVWCDAEEGRGATFFFTVAAQPLVVEDGSPAQAAPAVSAA
jgi:light-regulated signal transduction histidine kinase (bacteriophytochrome)